MRLSAVASLSLLLCSPFLARGSAVVTERHKGTRIAPKVFIIGMVSQYPSLLPHISLSFLS